MVVQMYLHYHDESGVQKAIEEFPDICKKYIEETMPKLRAQAEAWIKENIA